MLFRFIIAFLLFNSVASLSKTNLAGKKRVLTSDNTNKFNQLSFSGGGSFGAVEIGILKRIMETDSKKYDLYTGISAGALNSGFLSYFSDLKLGVKSAEKLYDDMHNLMVYNVFPPTGVSVLNTAPLFHTITGIIDNMPNEPVINTLIGATNLYSGNLDVYSFEDNNDDNKVLLLMSSSAIPGVFPPIHYNDQLYADGGTLSNELLQVKGSTGKYINITYITPSQGYTYNDDPIETLKDMLVRVFKIVSSNFNNPVVTLNQNCDAPIGEINKYFVSSEYLKDYSSLDFDFGKELVAIGYKYAQRTKLKLC
jgi:predicted patatin/cPLA2 family phospholipase